MHILDVDPLHVCRWLCGEHTQNNPTDPCVGVTIPPDYPPRCVLFRTIGNIDGENGHYSFLCSGECKLFVWSKNN